MCRLKEQCWYDTQTLVKRKKKRQHTQHKSPQRPFISLWAPLAEWGNSKVLWKQVELKLVPVIMLDVEVIADSRSSIILAVCNKCACAPGSLNVMYSANMGKMCFHRSCNDYTTSEIISHCGNHTHWVLFKFVSTNIFFSFLTPLNPKMSLLQLVIYTNSI